MYCSKCSVENQDGSKFCSACGFSINASSEAPLPEVSTETFESDDDNLDRNIEIFVGQNYGYFEKKWLAAGKHAYKYSWNWVAFLFPGSWLAYRKMYLYSLLAILGELALGIVLTLYPLKSEFKSLLYETLLALILGLSCNYWYKLHAEKKVCEIADLGLTPEKTRDELIKQGGVSMSAAVIATLSYAIAVGIAGALFYGDIQNRNHTDGNANNPASQVSKFAELAAATPAQISPTGELAAMFNLMSDNTDLQRENKFKELKGKVVEWTLPVYEVQKDGEVYEVQTEADEAVGAFVYITALNTQEKAEIEGLKTGSSISFKGVISDVTLRSLEIKPAILFHAGSSSPDSIQVPASLSSDLKQEKVTTRYGIVSVKKPAEYGDDSEIYINEKKLPVRNAYISIDKKWEIGNEDILLISTSMGGNGCASFYVFLVITEKQAVTSEESGNCGMPEISRIKDSIFVKFPRMNLNVPAEITQYENGKVYGTSSQTKKVGELKLETTSVVSG